MSPGIALAICIVVVLILLKIEGKTAADASLALWLPTIWMISIISKPLGVWFPSAGEDAEFGSPLDQIFLIGVLSLGLLILVKRKYDWGNAIKENKWAAMLLIYMLVSILWSEVPFISFKRWIKELVAIVMASLVVTERDPQQSMESIFRRTAYILIPFSELLIKYFSEFGREYNIWTGGLMWVGVTTHKNSLGELSSISFFFLYWALIRRWKGHDVYGGKNLTYADVFVLILSLWLLYGPPGVYSATAVVSLAMGIVAHLGLLLIKNHKIILGNVKLMAIMAIIICYGIVTPMLGGKNLSSFTSELGRSETLTGRTEIWDKLIPIAERNPLLGVGFGAFWLPETFAAIETNEAHNGYLDLRLQLGFVGVIMFSIFLLGSCRKAYEKMIYEIHWGSLWICFLLMLVLQNISESSINSFTRPMSAIILFLTISAKGTASTGLRALQEAESLRGRKY